MIARIRTNWQASWIRLAALFVAIAIALGMPAAAHAGNAGCAPTKYKTACETPQEVALAPLSYTGWTYLNLNYCAPAYVCKLSYAISTSAWKWSGKAWNTGSIRGGWAYVAPFGGGFRWAWTQESGWVAISGQRFEIRPFA